MSNEAQFHTPGEAIAAVEDALSFLAHSVVSRGSGKEQLEFIARARKASGRFVSLIAVGLPKRIVPGSRGRRLGRRWRIG